MPAGRKSARDEWASEDNLLRIEGWAREGATLDKIANNIGISVSTLCEWKNKRPEIDEAIKKGNAPVDMKVENSMLKRALGYEVEEEYTEITDDGHGNVKSYTRRTKKHILPDVTAQIFWLKNRRPDRWRDKPAPDTSADDPLFELLKKWNDAAIKADGRE